MTSLDPQAAPGGPQPGAARPSRVVIELTGLLSLLAGAAGVGVAAWAYDWRLGVFTASAEAMFGGWRLTTTSEE